MPVAVDDIIITAAIGAAISTLFSAVSGHIFSDGGAAARAEAEARQRTLDGFLRTLSAEFSVKVEDAIRIALLNQSFLDIKTEVNSAAELIRAYCATLTSEGNERPEVSSLHIANEKITISYQRLKLLINELLSERYQDKEIDYIAKMCRKIEIMQTVLLTIITVDAIILVKRFERHPNLVPHIVDKLNEYQQLSQRLLDLYLILQPLRVSAGDHASGQIFLTYKVDNAFDVTTDPPNFSRILNCVSGRVTYKHPELIPNGVSLIVSWDVSRPSNSSDPNFRELAKRAIENYLTEVACHKFKEPLDRIISNLEDVKKEIQYAYLLHLIANDITNYNQGNFDLCWDAFNLNSRNKLLCKAAEHFSWHFIRLFREKGLNINISYNDNDDSLLHVCLGSYDSTLIGNILAFPELDLSCRNRLGHSAIDAAMALLQEDMATLIFQTKFNRCLQVFTIADFRAPLFNRIQINNQDTENNDTALHKAIRLNNRFLVEQLFQKNINILIRNRNGLTARELAIQLNYLDLARLINLNEAFLIAAHFGDLALMRAYLQRGAAINSISPQYGTALHILARMSYLNNAVEIVEFLLNAGANCLISHRGYTPKDLAERNAFPAMITAINNFSNFNPSVITQHRQQLREVNCTYCFENNIDRTARHPDSGNTVLQNAIIVRDLNLFEHLVSHADVDRDAVNNAGQTVEFLLNRLNDLDFFKCWYAKNLMVAARNGDLAEVQNWLSRGARVDLIYPGTNHNIFECIIASNFQNKRAMISLIWMHSRTIFENKPHIVRNAINFAFYRSEYALALLLNGYIPQLRPDQIRNSEFLAAIERNDVAAALPFIVDPNDITFGQNSRLGKAFLLAAKLGYVEMLRQIIDQPFFIFTLSHLNPLRFLNTTDEIRHILQNHLGLKLYHGVEAARITDVKSLIKFGISPNYLNPDTNLNILQRAVQRYDIPKSHRRACQGELNVLFDLIPFLTYFGADPLQGTLAAPSALQIAQDLGKQNLVDHLKFAINEGFLRAVQWSNIADMERYLRNGANINHREGNGGRSALHLALVYRRNMDVINFLFDNNINPYIKDVHGRTAFNFCREGGGLPARPDVETRINQYGRRFPLAAGYLQGIEFLRHHRFAAAASLFILTGTLIGLKNTLNFINSLIGSTNEKSFAPSFSL